VSGRNAHSNNWPGEASEAPVLLDARASPFTPERGRIAVANTPPWRKAMDKKAKTPKKPKQNKPKDAKK
jgi:hypothetical protein